MAKGKGKGKDNDKGSCCCCICFLLFLPPIMIIIGIIMLVSGNTRVHRIKEYNVRGTEWRDNGLAYFKDKTFKVVTSTNIVKEMTPVTTTSGSNYPVRDTCKKDGDPDAGCVYTDALFYESSVPYASSVSVHVTDAADQDILNNQYNYNTQKIYYPSDLGCSDDTSKCSSKCSSKGGYWSSASRKCTVNYYLSEVCLRVNFKGEKWVLDNPAAYTLSGSGYGCYYSNSYSIPVYTTSTPGSEVPVTVRYYKDSFIAAEEFTMGCSSRSSTSTSCFGMSRKEQNATGAVIVVIGVIFFALEIGGIVAMCMCCKSTLTGMTKKKTTQPVQYAQPVQYNPPQYAQPVQYGQPQYGQPQYGQPQYAQPVQYGH